MTLQIKNGSSSLLAASGSLANSADCCCDNCICSTLKTALPNCQCIDGDYGTYRTIQANVTITGSGDPQVIKDNVSNTEQCAAGTCPDITGTYNYSCQSPSGSVYSHNCFSEFVCQDADLGFLEYHHYAVIIGGRFTYDPSTTTFAMLFAINSGYLRTASSSAPTIDCTNSVARKTVGSLYFHERGFTWSSSATYNDYLYLTSDCNPANCPNITQRAACPSGSSTVAWSSTSNGTQQTRDVCNLQNYTVDLSFTLT